MPRTKEMFEAMRDATRKKIEYTALSLFARKGISITIGEIAEAAGISKGLLYNHYPSKDALILELVRQATSMSGKAIQDCSCGNESAADRVKQITDMMYKMFSEIPQGIEYFMFMVQVGMSGFQVTDAAYYSQDAPNPIESFTEIIRKGQAEGSVFDGDPLQLATAYWATIQGLCCYAITGMPALPEQRVLNRLLLKEERGGI